MASLTDLINIDISDSTEKFIAEYFWIDAAGSLWSETRTLSGPVDDPTKLPKWNFDGSGTGQAPGHNSEVIILYPQAIIKNPSGSSNHIRVMCDTTYPDVAAEVPWVQGSYHGHSISIIVTDKMTALCVKIKSFIKDVCYEGERNLAEYMNLSYKLAVFALSKSVSGDAAMWKVYYMTGFATFAIGCYCVKLSVERKRAQLTLSSLPVTPTNSNKVLTATNALEFLFPSTYLRVAFGYCMLLNLKDHPSEDFWKKFLYATKICIDVLAALITVVCIIETRNKEQQAEDQSVAHPPEVEHGDVKHQSAELVKMDVKYQSAEVVKNQSSEAADPLGMPVYVGDVESQLSADANRQKAALQIDGKNE